MFVNAQRRVLAASSHYFGPMTTILIMVLIVLIGSAVLGFRG
jgi:hypothetical protein